MSSSPRALVGLSLLVAALGLAQRTVAAERAPALSIAEGSVASSQLVALGRDLEVDGEALTDVVAVNGSVRVRGRVGGDVIVLGGDALIGVGARVRGDVFVLGGRLRTERGAQIDGRSVSYPSLGSAWLTLLEGPSLGLSPVSAVVLGTKLALLAAWAALALVLMATSGREVLATSERVGREPFRSFFVGLTGVLALLLTALFVSSLAAAVVGVPLLALVILFALVLKLWGMVAVFHATGGWLSARLLRRRWLPLNAAVLGLLVLGGLKLLPWVGTWVWTVATLIGVGATLTSKLGRREPWIQLEVRPAGRAAG